MTITVVDKMTQVVPVELLPYPECYEIKNFTKVIYLSIFIFFILYNIIRYLGQEITNDISILERYWLAVRFESRPHYNILMPSSQITCIGRPIFSVGQPKQVQPSDTFIKSINLKLL